MIYTYNYLTYTDELTKAAMKNILLIVFLLGEEYVEKIMTFSEYPHRRYNPLTGEWILVSPHRTQRPWQGKEESVPSAESVSHDEKCYLCPGNLRAGGVRNPDYRDTFVFTNDFSALLEDIPLPEQPPEQPPEQHGEELFTAVSERGICRVICFSPKHDATLARMDRESIRKVVDVWVDQFIEIGAVDFIRYVQIFENRGEIMGSSNPHPHGQIWANEHVPHIPLTENRFQEEYFAKGGKILLLEYLAEERERGERIIFENDSFTALVPYWAVWPFETMILPKRHVTGIDELTGAEGDDLADALKRMTVRFDNIFKTSFPYSMGLHQRPTDAGPYDHWQFHIHFLPPLLRSASVKKFMVGYELLANPQRDITAEKSAEIIRSQPEIPFGDAP